MLDLTVTRTVTRPEYQVFSQRVLLNNADKLTPKTARYAIQVAFGGDSGATVMCETHGYRVYPNSIRKVYPELY